LVCCNAGAVVFAGALLGEAVALGALAGQPVSVSNRNSEQVVARVQRPTREVVFRFAINLLIVRVGRADGFFVGLQVA
jgi:hypothetical protein